MRIYVALCAEPSKSSGASANRKKKAAAGGPPHEGASEEGFEPDDVAEISLEERVKLAAQVEPALEVRVLLQRRVNVALG